MKKSLSERLLNYIRKQETWVASGQLQRLAMENGYTPSNASRRLRELENDNLLKVEYREKNHAYYAPV